MTFDFFFLVKQWGVNFQQTIFLECLHTEVNIVSDVIKRLEFFPPWQIMQMFSFA